MKREQAWRDIGEDAAVELGLHLFLLVRIEGVRLTEELL